MTTQRTSTLKTYALIRLIALLALPMLAVLPLLSGQMIETADGALHLTRVPILRDAMADGSLWPRFAPGTVFGYGSPLFNYYSPASIYPTVVLNLLGLSPLSAWLLTMIAYTVVAGAGAALWTRQWAGDVGAVVAGVAYAYAPYMLVDVLWRGTTSETAALAILPWVLWAVTRAVRSVNRTTIPVLAVLFALLILSHNIMALHGAALVGLYALLCLALEGRSLTALSRITLGLGCGALLTMFYWLPALGETAWIKVDAITANLPEIDVVRNLAPLAQSFALPTAIDPAQQQPPAALALSWVGVILGSVGIIAGWRGRLRGVVIFCGVALVFLMFMTTPESAAIWRIIPLIRYSQYPTRLLGPASLLVALLSGVGVASLWHVIQNTRLRIVMLTCVLAALMLAAVPYLYRQQITLNPLNVGDTLEYEAQTGLIGTSSFGEYVPVWTSELPDRDVLRAGIDESSAVPRLRPPDGVTIDSAEWRRMSASLNLSVSEATTVTFDWLFLPNWVVRRDGQGLPVKPSVPDGRLSVDLPAGQAQIEVELAQTSAQALAGGVSAAAAIGLGALMLVWGRLPLRSTSLVRKAELPGTAVPWTIALLCVGGVLLLKVAVIDRINNPLRFDRFGDSGIGIDSLLNVDFAGQVQLIGLDRVVQTVQDGQIVEGALYWRLLGSAIQSDLISVISLVDARGIEITQVRNDRPGGVETHHWRSGGYLRQPFTLEIPDGTLPGEVELRASLYDPAHGVSLDVLNSAGNPEGVSTPLRRVTVSPAPEANSPASVLIESDSLQIASVFGLPDSATVGDPFLLSVEFALSRQSDSLPPVQLLWVTSSGETLRQPLQLLDSDARTLTLNRTWTARIPLYIPADLATGTVTVALEVGSVTVEIGQVAVDTPLRNFDLPANGNLMPALGWANGIELLAVQESSDALTLYWRWSESEPEFLRRFTHVVSPDGQIIQVIDGVPADWTRPTTGWASGEVVADRLAVTVPAGYRLVVGWVDNMGNRVQTATGSDSAVALDKGN